MISVYHIDGRYEIGGRTWPHRDILREWGARWDPATEVWWTSSDVAVAQIRSCILAAVHPEAMARGVELRLVRRHEVRPPAPSRVIDIDGTLWCPIGQTVWRDQGCWWDGVDLVRAEP